jgi:hypothetical protein
MQPAGSGNAKYSNTLGPNGVVQFLLSILVYQLVLCMEMQDDWKFYFSRLQHFLGLLNIDGCRTLPV